MGRLFGPVPSRRFGRSLGVDLTPFKTCCLDCVFCQLGRTTRKTAERMEYIPTGEVLTELDQWITRDGHADVITLAGSGEPTLHTGFGQVIEHLHQRCSLPVLLLTNGTLLHRPDVRAAAAQANRVKVSLSAWDEGSFCRINRPCSGLTFEGLLAGEIAFRKVFKGTLFVEVFLLQGINSEPDQVRRIAEFVKRIEPDRVQLNTAVRPPAEETAVPVSREQLSELAALFTPSAEIIAPFRAEAAPDFQANEATILAMLQRRPCTAADIAGAFSMHPNEVAKYLGKLQETGKILDSRRGDMTYYQAADRP